MARLEDASTTDQMIVHLGSLFRHNPVSYTHLDVYKRQTLDLIATFA